MRILLTGLALILTAFGGATLAPAPAVAQDYLGAYQHAQQYGNLRRHQQRMRQRSLDRRSTQMARERRYERSERYDRAQRSRRYDGAW